MTTINALNPKTDLSVRVFDGFYNFEIQVPASEYEVVYSFFRSVFTTNEAAGNFTVSLFRIAAQTQTPVLTLLQQMEGKNQLEINSTLAYYLNNLRSPATLLGIGATVTPNYYAARNVRS
jgi:pyruvate/2-oxoacid:ferredoxin oxidoreductase alpha subunit